MNARTERTAGDWFREAAQAYVEGHQACVWCGEAHRVYRNERGGRVEYYCAGCEFYAIHDGPADRYFAAPGRPEARTHDSVTSAE